MKLLPKPPTVDTRRVSGDNALGHGIDAAVVVAFLLGVGYALDRWLGTGPWLIIGCTVLAFVGLFAKFKYQYDAQMTELDAQRRQRLEGEPSIIATAAQELPQ